MRAAWLWALLCAWPSLANAELARRSPYEAVPEAPAEAPPAPQPKQTPERRPHKSSTDLATDELLRRATRDIARGRLGRAARHYHDALRLQPNHVNALVGLAALRRKQGDTDEARRLLQKAARKSNGAAAHDALAELETDAGRVQQALAHRQAAVNKRPTEARLASLADEYVRARAYPAALCLWRRLQALRPSATGIELQIDALTLLSDSLDPVLAGAETDDWVRRSLSKLSLSSGRPRGR